MSNYIELQCASCQKPLDVWYEENGAPFNHWYECADCKQKEELEREAENE